MNIRAFMVKHSETAPTHQSACELQADMFAVMVGTYDPAFPMGDEVIVRAKLERVFNERTKECTEFMHAGPNISRRSAAEINKLPKPSTDEVIIFFDRDNQINRSLEKDKICADYDRLKNNAAIAYRQLSFGQISHYEAQATVAKFSECAVKKGQHMQTDFIFAQANRHDIEAEVMRRSEVKREAARKRNEPFFQLENALNNRECAMENADARIDRKYGFTF